MNNEDKYTALDFMDLVNNSTYDLNYLISSPEFTKEKFLSLVSDVIKELADWLNENRS